MTIPSVTLPIEQENVRATHDKLFACLQSLQADVRTVLEMLKLVRALCKHPKAKDDRCPDCGHVWGD